MKNLPHVTVATVVEKDGKFLLVEELSDGDRVYNQPAGHVELNESLQHAAVRETLEETAWEVQLKYFLGIYHHHSRLNGISYIRNCFIAHPVQQKTDFKLDDGIIRSVWLSLPDIESLGSKLRSPLVLTVIKDYLAGKRYPLQVVD